MAKHRARGARPTGAGTAAGPSFLLFALILGCFFFSGVTGLTYEILWTRMIVEIIGSSPFAVSIVLTIFMGGLGLGSYLAGKRIDRVRESMKLVRIYGALELCIGAYGIVLPFLLKAFKPLYAALYNRLFDHFLLYNFLTFVGCAVLLIVPVTLMGATLPILSRFFITSLSRVATRVGWLYGFNTIGAAVGSLLCGFWLINLLGVWGTLLAAVLVNGMIGGACILASARSATRQMPADAPAPAAGPPSRAESRFGAYALVIFAVSGFCAMAYEVIWIRLLGLMVGPTTYSFTLVLVTFITALALGALFFGWLGDRVRNVMALLLGTQTAAALFALAFSQLAGNSQVFFAKLIDQFKDDLGTLYLLKAGALFLFMFPPAFCLGATFPLVGKIYTDSLSRTGRSIGFAYALNSVGAVLGSFCAGFILIPYAGKENGLSIVIALQLLTALIVAARVFSKTGTPALRWAPLALAVLAGLGLVLRYPEWDRKALAKGKYQRIDAPEIRSVSWLSSLDPASVRFAEDEKEELLYYGDGVGGFTAVLKKDVLGDPHYSLLNSGKPDASFPGDMATQTLFAHFPMLFHPGAKRVLVVGLASGITAGEVLHYPVERLDVVDINGKVVEASDHFRKWNNDVLSNERTRLIIQDARAHLAMTKEKYDVISSEPSNPWMAGLASLFTRDFFELARDRLNDGGIFVQFAHAYSMDWRVFSMVGRTFAAVFPNSLLLNTDPVASGGDYLLIGIKGEGGLDAGAAERNLEYAQRSKNITLLDHRLFYNLILHEDLEQLFGDGPVHSENRPYLEYAAPKLIFTNDPAIEQNIAGRKRLSEKTESVIREIASDLDARIDFAAYALSVYRPMFALQNRVDLSDAAPAQKERLARMLESYCGANVEAGAFLLADEDIRERCVSAQIAMIKSRMSGSVDRVSFLKRLGGLYSDAGRLDEAVEVLSEALVFDPNDAETHIDLGIALARQRRFDQAVDHYRKAIGIAPYSPRAYNNLGAALAEQGREEEAMGYFAESLKRDGDYADAHYNMGNALAARGLIEEAASHLAAAARLKPDFVEAHHNLANAYFARMNFEAAAVHYGAALRHRPDYAQAQYGLGLALLGLGRTREAVERLSMTVERWPDYAEALTTLAWTLATSDDPAVRDGARAVALAQRASELSGGESPQALDTLAAAYAESGDFEKATQTARQAVTLSRAAGRRDWTQTIEQRLSLYEQGRPFRSESR